MIDGGWSLADEDATQALQVLEMSATQVGFGFGWRGMDGSGLWSPQLKAMFGLDPQGPTPSRAQLLEMVEPADRDRIAADLARPARVHDIIEHEYAIRTAQGQRRVIMTRAVMRSDAQGRPWRSYFMVLDLTNARARDLELAATLERLQMATQACGIGTWSRRLGAERSEWDAATWALFGREPAALGPTPQEFLAMVHPDDRPAVARQLRTVHSGPPAAADDFEFEYRVCWPDGRVRWLLTRGRTHRGAGEASLHRTGIVFDVTERHEAQDALQAKALAERANAAKTEFLARMSHELRTPLNAVLGFAQLLSMDGAHPLSDGQRQRVGHIQNAGWHLLALINDVLDLARIEARQTQFKPELVPLDGLIDECLAMNQGAAQGRGITLRTAAIVQDAPAQAWADPMRVRQVLLNLISNAIKYNHDGGWVEVATEAAAEGRVAVCVRDGGPGLTPEQLQHLFEPFNRLGRERSAVEGTGIGLTLSRLIAEQMGGQLLAGSAPGQGCEFRLVLPTSP